MLKFIESNAQGKTIIILFILQVLMMNGQMSLIMEFNKAYDVQIFDFSLGYGPKYIPEMLETISPELKKRMQGKSCFNFRTVDEALFDELTALTKRGYERFKLEK